VTTTALKPVGSLTPADLKAHPVWSFAVRRGSAEIHVRPVKTIPVSSLANRIVGTKVRLANQRLVWALIGNVQPADAKLTEHFLTLSVERDGGWFHLARHFDFDRPTRGPAALAGFLGHSVDEVFPILYDIRPFVKGQSAVLVGEMPAEPRERLTRAQVIALSVP
jgi:hypothetical protein